jgi:hypothetical protein
MEPELPAGMQDFEKLVAKKGLYVDKTKYFPLLPKRGDVIFCARPRRFGKSLTVTALDAFHSGKKELFSWLGRRKIYELP